MPDHNKMSEEDKNKKGGEFKMPPRTWFVWIAIICTVVFVFLLRNNMDSRGELLSPYKFNQLLDSNLIVQGTINFGQQSAMTSESSGKYYKVDTKEGKKIEPPIPFWTKIVLTEPMLERLQFDESQFELRDPNTMLWSVLWSVLPVLLIGAFIWFIFIRQITMAGKRALSIGTSKA